MCCKFSRFSQDYFLRYRGELQNVDFLMRRNKLCVFLNLIASLFWKLNWEMSAQYFQKQKVSLLISLLRIKTESYSPYNYKYLCCPKANRWRLQQIPVCLCRIDCLFLDLTLQYTKLQGIKAIKFLTGIRRKCHLQQIYWTA